MPLNKETETIRPNDPYARMSPKAFLIFKYRLIRLVRRVFANGPGDRVSIPKTPKIVVDTSSLNTQYYKVRMKKCKVEQSRARSSTLPYSSVQSLLKKESSGRPRLRSPTLLYISSSSCHAISTEIPDPLSLSLHIVHCFRQVLRTTSRIGTELLYVGSSWSSCLCSSM